MSIYVPPGLSEDQKPKNFGNAIGSFFQNLFKPAQADQSQILANQNFNPLPGVSVPESYQVKPEDNDLAQVANSLNVPLQQLVDNNNGSKTLPPTGSFISVNPAVNPNQTGAPATGSFVSGSGQVNTGNAALNQSFVSSNRLATIDDRPRNAGSPFAVQQMLNSGIDPQIISSAAAAQMIDPNTGAPISPQTLVALGYAQNPTTGNYEKTNSTATTTPTATPAAPSAFSQTAAAQQYAAQNTAFTEQMRWDPKRGRYVKIGQLLREGKLNLYDQQGNFRRRKKEREEGVAAPPPEAANAPETSANVLQLRLGSG